MRAGALSGCVRLDHAPPHHTTHHAHQGSSFWSILDAFLLLFPLFARIENPWIGTRAYTRVFPVRRGVSLLNQGFGVELTDAIALIIN